MSNIAASPLVSASPFLQHLINEQRAARESRAVTPSDNTGNDSRPRTPMNSQSQEDLSSEKQRKVANALSADLRQPEEMGVREMDQYVHKLNKQNFDLKLDIFHRAQQMDSMKKKLERMQELEEQVQQMELIEEELQGLRDVEVHNQMLRETNEQLQVELGTRDQAIGEAVDLICDLETRIDELELGQEMETTQQSHEMSPVTSDTGATSLGSSLPLVTPKNQVMFNVPDRTSSRKGTKSTASQSRSTTPTTRTRRQPSFLRQDNESTIALRSVYSSRALSIVSQAESVLSGDEERQCPASPNLSILSECSEFDPSLSPTRPTNRNVSRLKPLQPTFELEPTKVEASSHKPGTGKAEALSRVEQWMRPQEKKVETRTPIKSTTARRRDKQKKPSLDPAFRAERNTQSKLRLPAQDVPLFGSGRFPPTPDTMSTSHAINRNGSNPSIIVERSQYDSLYTPFTMERGPRKLRSTDDLNTRPSSGTTADGLEVESPLRYMANRNYPLASMFPTYAQITPASSRVKDHFTPDQSEPDSTKPQASNSSPLSPEDWLEAALCTPIPSQEAADEKDLPAPPMAEDETPFKSPNGRVIPSPVSMGRDLPPPGSLRARIGEDLHTGAKRVLNFRLFGRAVTVSHGPIANPDAVDQNNPLLSGSRLSRRHSTSRRHSSHIKDPVIIDDEVVEDDETTALPPFTRSNPFRGNEPNNRPTTAGSLEYPKRRSGHGLFGWMRNKDAVHDNAAAHISPAALAATHFLASSTQGSKKSRVQQQKEDHHPATRPVSELGFVSAGGAADEGRKSKPNSRRFRRGKEGIASYQ